MDDTLLKYDESLQALEKQRESLELVMKRMGAEWEESGAGIGWLGDVLSNSSDSHDEAANTSSYSASSSSKLSTSLALKNKNPPLFHMMQSNEGPSHDYLQTLLNVNDELLAQSLASSTNMEGEDLVSNNNNNNNNNSNTRECNVTIASSSSLKNNNNNNINAFVAQQQKHQLISPLLTEEDQQSGIHSNLYQQQNVLNQSQLATPPITPSEQQQQQQQ